eukprot:7339615-Prorocentrum_lima.AAC.1
MWAKCEEGEPPGCLVVSGFSDPLDLDRSREENAATASAHCALRPLRKAALPWDSQPEPQK